MLGVPSDRQVTALFKALTSPELDPQRSDFTLAPIYDVAGAPGEQRRLYC
jgi:hypothetical protein